MKSYTLLEIIGRGNGTLEIRDHADISMLEFVPWPAGVFDPKIMMKPNEVADLVTVLSTWLRRHGYSGPGG